MPRAAYDNRRNRTLILFNRVPAEHRIIRTVRLSDAIIDERSRIEQSLCYTIDKRAADDHNTADWTTRYRTKAGNRCG